MNEITSFQTLIGSLYKKYNKARVYGKLNIKNLFILNIVNKLLYNCPDCLSNSDRNKLNNLVIKLQHLDKDICIYREDRNIYTNIGNDISYNNSYLNNSPIHTSNTAPTIEDPDPIDPEAGQPPKICEISKDIFITPKTKYTINKEELVDCFIDPNNPETGGIKYLKIVSLPNTGSLTYGGLNVEIGQNIDLTTLNNTDDNKLVYYSLVSGPTVDNFKYQVSTTSYPNIYNEEIVTLFIDVS